MSSGDFRFIAPREREGIRHNFISVASGRVNVNRTFCFQINAPTNVAKTVGSVLCMVFLGIELDTFVFSPVARAE